MPKNYEKPRIEIDNYFLKWDDDNKSYGIHPREIAELKAFLKKAIIFFDTREFYLHQLLHNKHVLILPCTSTLDDVTNGLNFSFLPRDIITPISKMRRLQCQTKSIKYETVMLLNVNLLISINNCKYQCWKS